MYTLDGRWHITLGKVGIFICLLKSICFLEVKLCLEVEHMICWLEPLEKWTPQVDTPQQITASQSDFFLLGLIRPLKRLMKWMSNKLSNSQMSWLLGSLVMLSKWNGADLQLKFEAHLPKRPPDGHYSSQACFFFMWSDSHGPFDWATTTRGWKTPHTPRLMRSDTQFMQLS